MAHWKLTLMYDGSAFHGWQVQPGLQTIQGTLAEALARITGETILPQGSGRTDTGVHALGQVCSFTLQSPVPAANLQRALNRILPAAIRVVFAEHVPPGFHARHSARCKAYEYRLFPRRGLLPGHTDQQRTHPLPTASVKTEQLETGDLKTGKLNLFQQHTSEERLCSPFLASFVWDVRWPLDLASMERAAAFICGTHDFTSFAAADPDRSAREATPDAGEDGSLGKVGGASEDPAESPVRPSQVRTVFQSVFEPNGDLLLYRVTGNGFLHHMVRNLVGTLVDVGRGRLAPTDIPSILAARDRSAAGPTAPARGLFLVGVEYSESAHSESAGEASS